jgi:hypothetical protein
LVAKPLEILDGSNHFVVRLNRIHTHVDDRMVHINFILLILAYNLRNDVTSTNGAVNTEKVALFFCLLKNYLLEAVKVTNQLIHFYLGLLRLLGRNFYF